LNNFGVFGRWPNWKMAKKKGKMVKGRWSYIYYYYSYIYVEDGQDGQGFLCRGNFGVFGRWPRKMAKPTKSREMLTMFQRIYGE